MKRVQLYERDLDRNNQTDWITFLDAGYIAIEITITDLIEISRKDLGLIRADLGLPWLHDHLVRAIKKIKSNKKPARDGGS